jgi:hypothetical protein
MSNKLDLPPKERNKAYARVVWLVNLARGLREDLGEPTHGECSNCKKITPLKKLIDIPDDYPGEVMSQQDITITSVGFCPGCLCPAYPYWKKAKKGGVSFGDDPTGIVPCFQSYLKELNYSPRTQGFYLHTLMKFRALVAQKPPAEWSSEDVLSFIQKMAKKGISASTQSRALNVIKLLFAEVLRRPLLEEIRVKRPKG